MSISAPALETLLSRKRELEAGVSARPALRARIRELRAWQADRLAGTYRDFSLEERYAKAVAFFLTDLYGPHDTSARDAQLVSALDHLERALPRSLLHVLEQAVELDVLTAELDRGVAERLAAGPVTGKTYAAAYRAAGQRAARERQIELVSEIGAALERAVRRPAVNLALRLARIPAQALGFGALQDFLERGFAAFRAMPEAAWFLRAIRERETELNDALLRDESAHATR